MNAERELEIAAQIIIILVKEYIENKTEYIDYVFKHAHRDVVYMQLIRPLASENAYNEFLKITGKDIRKCKWNYVVKIKRGFDKLFVWEHMTPAKTFKAKLIQKSKEGTLTTEFIKNLILQQKICWITIEEERCLNSLGYRSDRENPEKAYVEAGIKIRIS